MLEPGKITYPGGSFQILSDVARLFPRWIVAHQLVLSGSSGSSAPAREYVYDSKREGLLSDSRFPEV